jgi:hypothetical protein
MRMGLCGAPGVMAEVVLLGIVFFSMLVWKGAGEG